MEPEQKLHPPYPPPQCTKNHTEMAFPIYLNGQFMSNSPVIRGQKPHFQSWLSVQFSSVHSLSHVWLFRTPWNTAHQVSLSITNSQSLLKLMFTESVMPSRCLILYCTLLLQPLIFPNIRVFFNEATLCIRWPKYWSLSFNINPSNEYSGLTSIRIDWFDLLSVQRTLKSLL